MLLDLNQKGLRVAFPHDWQVEVMMEAWKKGQITSAEAYDLCIAFGATVSRTSVIYFLNRMVEERILLSDPVKREGHLQALYRTNNFITNSGGLPQATAEAFKKSLVFQLRRALMEVSEGG